MPRLRTDRFRAEMCRERYYTFFTTFWSQIAAEKLVPSWYIEKQCDELQVIAERVFNDQPKEYDLAWNCPPGTSKSSTVSILLQPWLWTRMPSARIISGSYSERLALDLSRKSRDVVESDLYKTLFPEIVLREDQNTKGYFANTRGGIRYAVGVGGTVIGMHAHFILVDDPLDPQGALSDLVIKDANVWMTETLSRRKVNVMLTPTIIIMQRLHQDDPTGSMLNRKTRTKHVCIPGDTTWEVKPPEFKQFYSEDGLLDPLRLPRAALEEAFETLGEVGYACQYGQSPTPRGGSQFKVDRLSYAGPGQIPSKWKRGPIRFWDRASTAGGGTFTAGVKGALDFDDKVWILDVERGQWDSGFRERKTTEVAKLDGKYTKTGIEQEPGSGGKDSAEATVKRLLLAGYRATMVKATGDKELRADPFSVYVNMGKVVIVNAPWNRVFVEEMRFFPRSKYKDQIDAGSGMFSLLTRVRRKIGAL